MSKTKREVVEAEIVKSDGLPVDSELAEIAGQIQGDMAAFGELEQQAGYRALRIGLNLMRAKDLLAHGQFMAWVDENVTEVRRRQAHNFMRLAQVFVERKKLGERAFLLLEEGEDRKTKRVVQLAFDFIGEDSLNDVFRRYGIRDTGKPRGGARESSQDATDEARQMAYQAMWAKIMTTLHREGHERKSWAFLPRAEIENLDGLLTDMKHAIKQVLKK